MKTRKDDARKKRIEAGIKKTRESHRSNTIGGKTWKNTSLVTHDWTMQVNVEKDLVF